MEKKFSFVFVVFFSLVYLIQGKKVDLSNCGSSIGCFKNPPSCTSESDCKTIITWENNGDTIKFEIESLKDYVAIGFSDDRSMGKDSIHACLKQSSGDPVIRTYESTGRTKPTLVSYNGLSDISTQVKSSFTKCFFTRPKKTGNSKVYDLDKSYHLLVAVGDVAGNDMKIHSEKFSTSDKIDFSKPTNPGTGGGGEGGNNGENSGATNSRISGNLITITILFLFFALILIR